MKLVFVPSSNNLARDFPKSIDLLLPPICLVNSQNVAPTRIANGIISVNTASHSEDSGSLSTFRVNLFLSAASVILEMNSSDFGKVKVNVSFSS